MVTLRHNRFGDVYFAFADVL